MRKRWASLWMVSCCLDVGTPFWIGEVGWNRESALMRWEPYRINLAFEEVFFFG